MRTPRLLLVSLLALTVGVCALVLAAGHHVVRREADRPDGPGTTLVQPRSPTTDALAALRRWDRRRARAWARGDPALLARLYVPDSVAGRRDRAMLASYRRRGCASSVWRCRCWRSG